MRLGLLGARADRGGLGALTQEFARQLRPERVLGVDLGERGRGPADWSQFGGADLVVSEGMDDDLDAGVVRRFCDGLDVAYGAETLYRSDVAEIARSVGCRTVLHAMPELWRADMAPPDVTWAPTPWRLDRLPAGAPVVPVPVNRAALPHRRRTEARVLYHVEAPATLDRNGTRLLRAALDHVRADVEVITTGPVLGARAVGSTRDYHDLHPPAADLLVLPRRYGGLSLPLQECAAMRMGVLTLDLEPQRQWVPAAGLVPAYPWRTTRFPGGEFTVHAAEPRVIAAAIDRVAADPALAADLSRASDEHAGAISWERWAARYRRLLEEAAA